MFLAKRLSPKILPTRSSGLFIHLFEGDPRTLTASASPPQFPDAITIFIGSDGLITLENNRIKTYGKRRSRSLSASSYKGYHQSASAQLPKIRHSCYGFDILDRGWRVELDVWTSNECDEEQRYEENVVAGYWNEAKEAAIGSNYRTYLQLDTPMARSIRKPNYHSQTR